MASGDTIFTLKPKAGEPVSANSATLGWIADASTPNLQIPCLQFDGAADEHIVWFETLPSQYSETTGLTFSFKYAMDGVVGTEIEIEFRVLPIPDQTVLTGDLAMDGQTPVTITDTPDATANDFNYTTTGALAKASFGSAAPGTFIAIMATRDISVATNGDDLQLIEVYVTETT